MMAINYRFVGVRSNWASITQQREKFCMWLQQDGAICHTVRVTVDLLRDTFGEHFISRSEPVNWLPRSYDLPPLNSFCGVILKLISTQTSPLQLMHWKTT